MGFYLVGGKLGSGKTLISVGIIRDALRKKRRVASNLDLYLDRMLPRESKITATRLPDKPGLVDLELIGRGQEGIEESENGVLVLDECASWLNARTWNDTERQGVLNWMLHSRKLGWDVYLISQHMDQVDKQLRTSLIEFSVRCSRLDRLPIPFFSTIMKILTVGLWSPRFFKVHLGTIRYGVERESMIVERRMFRGRDLYPVYDTRQVFQDDHMVPVKGQEKGVLIPHVGIHTVLSPWHTFGRHAPRVTLVQKVAGLLVPPVRPRLPVEALRPKLAAVRVLMAFAPDVRLRYAVALARRMDGVCCSPV